MATKYIILEILNSNGFDFYKQKEVWTPLEAATVVSGYLYSDNLLECNFDEIKPFYEEFIRLLYEKSIRAVIKKKLGVSRIIPIKKIALMWNYKRQFPEFYESDKDYNMGHLKCFNPIHYVGWVKSERIVKIPPELMICADEQGMTVWTKSPTYDSNEKIN